MDQTNIVSIKVYREENNTSAQKKNKAQPEDLITAIKVLIERLRECDPIEQATG